MWRTCLSCDELVENASYCRQHSPSKRPKPHVRGPGWGALSKRILERDGYMCQIGSPGCTGRATTTDHIVPVSQGGGNEVTNLQAACRSCNSRKGNRA